MVDLKIYFGKWRFDNQDICGWLRNVCGFLENFDVDSEISRLTLKGLVVVNFGCGWLTFIFLLGKEFRT